VDADCPGAHARTRVLWPPLCCYSFLHVSFRTFFLFFGGERAHEWYFVLRLLVRLCPFVHFCLLFFGCVCHVAVLQSDQGQEQALCEASRAWVRDAELYRRIASNDAVLRAHPTTSVANRFCVLFVKRGKFSSYGQRYGKTGHPTNVASQICEPSYWWARYKSNRIIWRWFAGGSHFSIGRP